MVTLFKCCENMYKLKNIIEIHIMSQLKQAPNLQKSKPSFTLKIITEK